MSDAQVAGLIGFATLIATGLGKLVWSMWREWLVERKADRDDRKQERDADRTERREDRAAMLTVVREVSTGMATLGERVSSLERVFDRNDARITGTHEIPPEPLPEPVVPPRRTPADGSRIPRAITERPFDPRRER